MYIQTLYIVYLPFLLQSVGMQVDLDLVIPDSEEEQDGDVEVREMCRPEPSPMSRTPPFATAA